VPPLFEEYPAPLRPNKKAYLDLLRTCHAYLLIMERVREPLADGLSATHQEYRLPSSKSFFPNAGGCKSDAGFEREKRIKAFWRQVRRDGHTYSRFASMDGSKKLVHD